VKAPDPFDFWVEEDRIKVRFVPNARLGNMPSGHKVGGLYVEQVISLHRYDYLKSLRAGLMHELGHYLVERQELRPKDTTEEEVCDLLTWLPAILADPRNGALRRFLGL
jgi:hypothetical protein